MMAGSKLIHLKDKVELQKWVANLNIDILHVYRSGFEEWPIPGKDITVPHFIETNVFGFLDPNPLISRSLFMSEWLMDHAIGRNGIPIGHPIMDRFDFVNNPVESPASDNRLDFDIPEDSIVLGRCGRPDDGIYDDIAVKAARLLMAEGHKVHFLVAAPPPRMLEDLSDYGIPFHTIEPTTDPIRLSQFYNTVDIYTHFRADGETFGVNIAEAMIHGLPVVTHVAVPSHPAMGVFQSQTTLVEDGYTGFVVAHNVLEYAEAVKKLIENSIARVTMGVMGRQKAMREYHVKPCVQKLEEIYDDVCKQ
jgi:glycosyltransferase involved in cell wall biosynthesis